MRLRLGSRKSRPVAQLRVIKFAVVRCLIVFLFARLNAVEQWSRLLKQSPSVLQRPAVYVNDLIERGIDRVLDLANDRTVVDPRRNLVDRDAVFAFLILQR